MLLITDGVHDLELQDSMAPEMIEHGDYSCPTQFPSEMTEVAFLDGEGDTLGSRLGLLLLHDLGPQPPTAGHVYRLTWHQRPSGHSSWV